MRCPPLSVAPMMDRTDRHFRFMMRQITRHTLLYSEMVTTGAILRGGAARHLDFDPLERPLALQLGGDDPTELAACARIAADWGYDEVNLNVGCPSDRVQSGRFGAVLMLEPERVAACVDAMRSAVSIPVTVKHRIGVDALDRYEDMLHFVDTVAAAGCQRFTVHARKAWLSGLSPKENRSVPPLRYGDVYRLAAEHPELVVELNGGVRSLDDAAEHLDHVDAVMIGRAAWDDPWMFRDADTRYSHAPAPPLDGLAPDRAAVAEAMIVHAERRADDPHFRLGFVARPLLNLFTGQPGARAWKQALSEHAFRRDAGPTVLRGALAARAATSARH